MDAILKDLNSAYVKMNEQIALLDKRNAEVMGLVEKETIKIDALKKREEAVAVKELKYKEFDNVNVMRDAVVKLRSDINAEKKALQIATDALVVKQKEVESKEKSLDEKLAIYRQKTLKCDEMIDKLDKDRKDLEKNIIAQFTKNLTKG
jgi:hypothetical protein